MIFINIISLFKKAKKGVFSTGTAGRRGAGPVRMRHGMQGHMAEPHEPTWRLGGAEEAQMRGRGHVSPRGHPGSATWQVRGLAGEGPTG